MTSGQVVTCYSYKGGVGRSFTLANLAVILAQWQYRVLCVDWDLEAPGLAYYFKCEQSEPGLLEMIEAVAKHARPSGLRDVRSVRLADDCIVDVITTVARGPDYSTRVLGLDWEKLYDRGNLGHVLEDWRSQWMGAYDVVLVDSRTGITDLGGICTAALPDVLLLFFTPNQQSIDGALEVLDQAIVTRNRLVFDRPRLRTVPVVSRFEQGVEYERSLRWRQMMDERFGPCYRDWAAQGVSTELLVAQTTIPYSGYWSFGEDLPVLSENQRDPSLISYRFATLAVLLAHRLDNTDLLASSRDSYVDSASRAGYRQHEAFRYDALVSSTKDTRRHAAVIAELLTSAGFRVAANTQLPGVSWSQNIAQSLDDSRNLILVLGEESSPSQEREMRYVLRQALDDDSPRRVIPVITGPSALRSMPSIIQSLQSYDLSSSSVEETAREIGRVLAQTRGS